MDWPFWSGYIVVGAAAAAKMLGGVVSPSANVRPRLAMSYFAHAVVSIVPKKRLWPTTRYRKFVCPAGRPSRETGTGTTRTLLLNGAVVFVESNAFVYETT